MRVLLNRERTTFLRKTDYYESPHQVIGIFPDLASQQLAFVQQEGEDPTYWRSFTVVLPLF
jgi:hypothetical protein